jgi:hypothetical protein
MPMLLGSLTETGVHSTVVLHDRDQQSVPDKRINFVGSAVRLQRYR